MTRDPIFREYYRSDLADIYALAGRNDEAMALISEVLKYNTSTRRLDPYCDPLRIQPRFSKTPW